MRNSTFFIILLGFFANAQEIKKDSIKSIEEVKISALLKKKIETDLKMAVSVDEFLASSDNISFIKRGAFALEPLLNNMSSERSSVTIDGMHIFGACTDKMDPVTSYVESNNLSTIDIKSGQQGGLHGSTIAGSIDLKRKSSIFTEDNTFGGSYQSGFEFNNQQFFNLGNVSFTSNKWVADGSISYRKAGNYFDGKNQEINHSQYTKFNTSLGLAYRTGTLSAVRVDAIFDMAKNVGFPALPMDLWLSRALITSASYKKLFENGWIKAWDTKLYFNTIEHYMDDTTRPENLVHMDMPGWSTTFGLLSKINLKKEKYLGNVQLNAYQNLSIAEMRMYPQDRSHRTMFAYTWPWVTTRYAGISTNHSYEISEKSQFNFGGNLGVHYNFSKYVEFNWIFHPGTPQEKTRILPSINASYEYNLERFRFTFGAGYGHRAPSVSEAYGYYIYNSFDRYDYIGNPALKNEISYETNASSGFKTEKLGIEAKANYFYIQNYIIGRILDLGSPMNYQSVGVKGYTNLDHAKIFNFSLNAFYELLENLRWDGSITFARGTDDKNENLPFIRPLSYRTSLKFTHGNFAARTSINGDNTQINYSPIYGEDKTPWFMIWNASADYTFQINNLNFVLQAGVENILNEYYSTYADWGNIPRMGRNVFTSLKFNF